LTAVPACAKIGSTTKERRAMPRPTVLRFLYVKNFAVYRKDKEGNKTLRGRYDLSRTSAITNVSIPVLEAQFNEQDFYEDHRWVVQWYDLKQP
jgi:hypothetical protein